MKTKIVLAALLTTMVVLEVSAQREYDDMYFRGKDREKNKAIEADEALTPVKKKKQTPAEDAQDEDYYANPTDSYSARNVNPEYVSRSNSEQASDDEANYYSEDYQPATSDYNYNNSYYNNSNWARNRFYANSMWANPYYSPGFYSPWMSPYGGFGYNDPWMTPYAGPYAWGNSWTIAFGFGNYWGPGYGYGVGNGLGFPYYGYQYGYGYGYGGYGYPNYYYGGGYYESGRSVNYGKRPTQNSSAVSSTNTRPGRQVASNSNNTNVSSGRATRVRQSQDEYYVRPSRRTTTTPSFDNNPSSTPSSRPSRYDNGETIRSRGGNNYPSQTPSYSPSSSPSRGNSGGGSSGGGGGGARPRGRG